MIWNILIGISILALLIYLYYLRLFYRGVSSGKDLISYKKPFVSIVIAARNEEDNIARLLTALVNQSYSRQLYEIIVANDDSTDKTAEIVHQFEEQWENIHLVDVTGRDKVISPKKNALSQAIDQAQGEVILTTDADCIVTQYWIESMIPNFEKADMVVGFSRTFLKNWPAALLVQKFEHFDFLAIFLAAAGSVTNKRYFSCSGQNLAYLKSAFQEVGGFEKINHLISGDDVNLMQLFRQAGKTIKFSFNTHGYTFTQPVENWQQLFNQRGRWASNMKWQIILNPEFFVYLCSAFITTLVPVFLLFKVLWLAATIVFLRIIGEYSFLKMGFAKFGEEKNKLNFYLVWFILQPVYFVVVALRGMFDIFSWKK